MEKERKNALEMEEEAKEEVKESAEEESRRAMSSCEYRHYSYLWALKV